jgi:hypothetical protein
MEKQERGAVKSPFPMPFSRESYSVQLSRMNADFRCCKHACPIRRLRAADSVGATLEIAAGCDSAVISRGGSKQCLWPQQRRRVHLAPKSNSTRLEPTNQSLSKPWHASTNCLPCGRQTDGRTLQVNLRLHGRARRRTQIERNIPEIDDIFRLGTNACPSRSSI